PALVALALPLVVGCSKSNSAPRINAGGATFVDPIMQKWSGEYKRAKNVEVDYVAKGAGYGISNVTSKNIDLGRSDAPLPAKEMEAARAAGGEVVHIPVTIGAVAVIYNLPEVKDLKLSGEVVADIYRRTITKWNDPAIGRLNPGVALPERDIVPVYRAESSGADNLFAATRTKA